MKRVLTFLFLFSTLTPALWAQAVTVGMTEKALIELKGSPQTKASVGKKSIYRYADVQVTIIGGKVDSFQVRDKAAEERRSQEAAIAEANRKAINKYEGRERVLDGRESLAEARRDAAATNRATEERLRRAAILQEQIRSLERQLADDLKRSNFGNGPAPMSAEARTYINYQLDERKRELRDLR
jgi:hypothetical protein